MKIYPNKVINIEEKKYKKRKFKILYYLLWILFHKPNKDAINFLNQHIMPNVVKVSKN